jgi:hypothetical protein
LERLFLEVERIRLHVLDHHHLAFPRRRRRACHSQHCTGQKERRGLQQLLGLQQLRVKRREPFGETSGKRGCESLERIIETTEKVIGMAGFEKKSVLLLLAGFLAGSLGLRALASEPARKVYIGAVAQGLKARASAEGIYEEGRARFEDIIAEAEYLNESKGERTAEGVTNGTEGA